MRGLIPLRASVFLSEMGFEAFLKLLLDSFYVSYSRPPPLGIESPQREQRAAHGRPLSSVVVSTGLSGMGTVYAVRARLEAL
jgi:hypothetical protein